jgi:aldose 1-epimerase
MKSSQPLLFLFLLLTIASCINKKEKNIQNTNAEMQIAKTYFGHHDGQEIFLFTLKNINGMQVKITNYGGIITEILVPDKNGDFGNVVLGFDRLQDYLNGHPYFGAIVGRYANRIAKGKFKVLDKEYQLAINNGENALHGGIYGLDKMVWDPEYLNEGSRVGLRLKYVSPDMEEGYPGNLYTIVTYWLNTENELKIEYQAQTDKPTIINLCNHSYFNLNYNSGNSILGHLLKIDADKYTPVDETQIPTGELKPVAGTAFDFRKYKTLQQDFEKTEGGYDHNFALNNKNQIKKVLEVNEPISGRRLEVITDQPGLQLYTGNFLDGSLTGKGNMVYTKNFGFCLETQHYPDSPNNPNFPNTVLFPGQEFVSTTIYKFSVIN